MRRHSSEGSNDFSNLRGKGVHMLFKLLRDFLRMVPTVPCSGRNRGFADEVNGQRFTNAFVLSDEVCFFDARQRIGQPLHAIRKPAQWSSDGSMRSSISRAPMIPAEAR